VNVGENTTLGNGDVTQELVQLLIVADGKLEVTGNDTGLLVVAGGVSSQLENLSSEVLEDGSEVNGSTGTDTLSVVALAEQTVNTANGEGQTSLGGTAEDIDVSMKCIHIPLQKDAKCKQLTTARSCYR
jgi:sugar (pentulose or hexulose) kinase